MVRLCTRQSTRGAHPLRGAVPGDCRSLPSSLRRSSRRAAIDCLRVPFGIASSAKAKKRHHSSAATSILLPFTENQKFTSRSLIGQFFASFSFQGLREVLEVALVNTSCGHLARSCSFLTNLTYKTQTYKRLKLAFILKFGRGHCFNLSMLPNPKSHRFSHAQHQDRLISWNLNGICSCLQLTNNCNNHKLVTIWNKKNSHYTALHDYHQLCESHIRIRSFVYIQF